jgi:hypothetical protein
MNTPRRYGDQEDIVSWTGSLPYGLEDLKPDAASRYSPAAPDPLVGHDWIACCVKDCLHRLLGLEASKHFRSNDHEVEIGIEIGVSQQILTVEKRGVGVKAGLRMMILFRDIGIRKQLMRIEKRSHWIPDRSVSFRKPSERFGTCLYSPLRRQSGARDLLHLFAKTIQLAERGVHVGRDANALKLLVNDGRGEDVMFVEQILNNGVRL